MSEEGYGGALSPDVPHSAERTHTPTSARSASFENLVSQLEQLGPISEPPPSYSDAPERHHYPGLFFIDFLPNCVQKKGIFTAKVYEPFSELVSRANQWLSSNPQFMVRSCESIEFRDPEPPTNVGDVNESVIQAANESIYKEPQGAEIVWYLRGLRLWLVPRGGTSNNQTDQVLGYINFVPRVKDSGGFTKQALYESLRQTQISLNKYLSTELIEGEIINVETQEMRMAASEVGRGFDADQSRWFETGKGLTQFVFVFRIFYLHGAPRYQAIEFEDFLPQCLRQGDGCGCSKSQYDTFDSTMNSVRQWLIRCAERSKEIGTVQVVNVQSVRIKHESGHVEVEDDIENEMCTYMCGEYTSFVRIIRIVITHTLDQYRTSTATGQPLTFSYNVTQLHCKTFVPVQKTRGKGKSKLPQYETVMETRDRLMNWAQLSNVCIISVETVPLKIYSGSQMESLSDTYIDADKQEWYTLLVYRAYINGEYTEPDPADLPPVNELPPDDSQDCCCCCSII